MIDNKKLIALAKSNAKKSQKKFAQTNDTENYFRKLYQRFLIGDCVCILDKYSNGAVDKTHLKCRDNDIFVDVEVCDKYGVYSGVSFRVFKKEGLETPKYLIKL